MDALERPAGTDWPLSLVAFAAGTGLALALFVPLALAGWHLESIPLFLAATAGFAVASLVAAFMGLRFAAGLAAGRYAHLQPRRWRHQVWCGLAALAVLPGLWIIGTGQKKPETSKAMGVFVPGFEGSDRAFSGSRSIPT